MSAGIFPVVWWGGGGVKSEGVVGVGVGGGCFGLWVGWGGVGVGVGGVGGLSHDGRDSS